MTGLFICASRRGQQRRQCFSSHSHFAAVSNSHSYSYSHSHSLSHFSTVNHSHSLSLSHSNSNSHANTTALPALTWKPLERKQSLTRSIGQLSKLKLSALVLLTTVTGHIAAAAAAAAESACPRQLALTLAGTALCSASANAFNQWAEAPLDAQMPRTRARPLPRLAVTPLTAFAWASVAGLSGVGTLAAVAGWAPAGWAALTIVLYAGVYTPMKRFSVYNTWIGALVGALPPLIGWSAVDPALTCQALFLPALLYAWQFPHFMALSWNLRTEYARAGYHMAALLDPKLNGRVAFRYALATVPLSLAAASPALLDLCCPAFAFTASVANAALVGAAFVFWRRPGRGSARRLFFGSLLHLPVLLGLFLYHRKRSLCRSEE